MTIVAAAMVAFFHTTLICSTPSPAQALSGIREDVITISGVVKNPSLGGTAPGRSDNSKLPRRNPVSVTTRIGAAPRAALTLAPEIASAKAPSPDAWDYIVKVDPHGPMGYLSTANYGHSDGLATWVVPMFWDELMHEAVVTNTPPPTVDPDPPVDPDDLFDGVISTEDIAGPLKLIAYRVLFGGSTTRSAPPAKPALFAVSLADSRINSDSALLIAGIPIVNGHTVVSDAKQFRIQLTKLATGAHFCTPSDDAFVFDPLISISNAGRLFVAFNSSYGGGSVGSVLSLDLAALIAGGPVKVKCFSGSELDGIAPPHIDDGSKVGYFIAAPQISNVIKRFKFVMGANPAGDKLVATPDINVTPYALPPAATQPNGFHLYSGGAEFRVPSVQIGKVFWNVHTIDDGAGHSKVRLYKFNATGTAPLMETTLKTLSDGSDDLFAPSLGVITSPVKRAYVTFARTIKSDATKGSATLMQARGPSGSASHWKSVVIAKSPAQFSTTWLGQPCDPFDFAGCMFMGNTATLLDPVNSLVWSIGPLIIKGDGTGKETNWQIKGVGKPQ